jgi:hypothetical protein
LLERVDTCGNEEPARVPVYEWAAALALVALLPVQIALAAAGTGYFQDKYAISTSLGLAVTAAWLLPRIYGLGRIIQPVLATSTLIYILVSVGAQIVQVKRHLHQPPRARRALPPLLKPPPPEALPIVMASAFTYLPVWWYAPPELRGRLVYLSDLKYAEKQQDFLPELSLVLDDQYTPMQTEPYGDYLKSHPRFYVLTSGEPRLNWLPSRLSSEGWRLTPVGRKASDVLYLADRPK